MSGYLYLASPYSHNSRAVRDLRYKAVCEKAAELAHAGVVVYAPIVHWHTLAMKRIVPTGWDFWQAHDETMIKCSDGIVVLRLEGWQQSIGIENEIAYAQRIGKPVTYVDP